MKYERLNVDINENTHPHLKGVKKAWQTDEYVISLDEPKGFKHLRIRRIDDKPVHNWMDLQEIKNDLFGEDAIAIEIYPKKSDFKNGSNTYHIWTWEGITVPNLAELYEYRS